MSRRVVYGLIAISATLLLVLSFMVTNTFNVTKTFAATTSAKSSANLPCNQEYEQAGNGFDEKNVQGSVGGWADVYDTFHMIGCVAVSDHYQFDGSAGTDVYDNNGNFYSAGSKVTLTTSINVSGIGVTSFSFPLGASFSTSSNSIKHTVSGSNSAFFSYNNVGASIFTCTGISQVDTAVVTIDSNDYEPNAEVDLGCGGS